MLTSSLPLWSLSPHHPKFVGYISRFLRIPTSKFSLLCCPCTHPLDSSLPALAFFQSHFCSHSFFSFHYFFQSPLTCRLTWNIFKHHVFVGLRIQAKPHWLKKKKKKRKASYESPVNQVLGFLYFFLWQVLRILHRLLNRDHSHCSTNIYGVSFMFWALC